MSDQSKINLISPLTIGIVAETSGFIVTGTLTPIKPISTIISSSDPSFHSITTSATSQTIISTQITTSTFIKLSSSTSASTSASIAVNSTFIPSLRPSTSSFDASVVGVISTAVISILIGAILWYFSARDGSRKSRRALFGRYPITTSVSSIEEGTSTNWLSDDEFYSRSIGIMLEVVSVGSLIAFSVGLTLYSTVENIKLEKRDFEKDFIFSSLDHLTFLTLLNSLNSSFRIILITVLILVSSTLTAFLLNLELKKAKSHRLAWISSKEGGSGWEVGYLTIVGMEMTVERMKSILFSSGLGARQLNRGGELQEICVENVFVVGDTRKLEKVDKERDRLVKEIERTTVDFLNCFQMVNFKHGTEITSITTVGKRKFSLPKIRIIPHGPSSHYQLTSQRTDITSSSTFELYSPKTTAIHDSQFTEIGITRSTNLNGIKWELGDRVGEISVRVGDIQTPIENLEMMEISPLPSPYSIGSVPPSATMLLDTQLDNSLDLETSLEDLFREARTCHTENENVVGNSTNWLETQLMRSNSNETISEEPEMNSEFFPLVIPKKGVNSNNIKKLAITRNELISNLVRLDSKFLEEQTKMKLDLENGIGVKGFILVGIRISDIPDIRKMECRTVEQVRWKSFEREMIFKNCYLIGLVLIVLITVIPITILGLATNLRFFWNLQPNSFSTGLVITLVPVIIPIVAIIMISTILNTLIKGSNEPCEVNESVSGIRYTAGISIFTITSLIVISIFISTLINSTSNSMANILCLSPFLISFTFFFGIIFTSWKLGAYHNIKRMRIDLSKLTPREKRSVNDPHIRGPVSGCSVKILLATIFMTFSILIPLINIGIVIALIILFYSDTQTKQQKTIGSAGLYHIEFINFLIFSTTFQPLLLSLILLSNDQKIEGSISLVISIFLLFHFLFLLRSKPKALSIFSKKSLQVFGMNLVSSKESSIGNSRQSSNASRFSKSTTRRSIFGVSALEVLESFSTPTQQPLPLSSSTLKKSILPNFSFDEQKRKDYIDPLLIKGKAEVLVQGGVIGEDEGRSMRVSGLNVKNI